MAGVEATHSQSRAPECSAAGRAGHTAGHTSSPGTKRPPASSPRGCTVAHRALRPGLGSDPRPPPPRSSPGGRRERRARRAPRRRLTAPRQPARPRLPSPPRRRLKATASLAPRALSNWPRRPQNGATAGVGTAGTGQGPSAPHTHRTDPQPGSHRRAWDTK